MKVKLRYTIGIISSLFIMGVLFANLYVDFITNKLPAMKKKKQMAKKIEKRQKKDIESRIRKFKDELDNITSPKQNPTYAIIPFDRLFNFKSTNINKMSFNNFKLKYNPYEMYEFIKIEESGEGILRFAKDRAGIRRLKLHFKQWKTYLSLMGHAQISFTYSQNFPDKNSRHQVISEIGSYAFKPTQDLYVRLKGKVGENVEIEFDHNSKRTSDNTYRIEYRSRRTFITKLKAGNFQLSLPGSRYVVYQGGSKSAFGIEGEAMSRNKKLHLYGILSLTRGISATKVFTGRRTEHTITIDDYTYIKDKFYRLPSSNIDANSLRIYRTTTEDNSITIAGGKYIELIEGRDFTFDIYSGKIVLKRSRASGESLIATYTVGGSYNISTTCSTDEYFVDNGIEYIYLHKDGHYSRFERKNIYNLHNQNIDLSFGYNFAVMVKVGSNRADESIQSHLSHYYLNPTTGYLEFDEELPFAFLTNDNNYTNYVHNLYFDDNRPDNNDCMFYFRFDFTRYENTFQLHFNVIPGSEVVLVNGRRINPNQYRINYIIGRLTITDPSLISDNTRIEVHYEYRPFGGTLQRTLIGFRGDYKPLKYVNIGGTLLHTGSAKPVGAPRVYDTPDSKLVFDIDANIDIVKALRITNTKLQATLRGEYAYSVYDKNRVDKAILDDMEGASSGYSILKNEDIWQLGSMSTNLGLNPDERGKIIYKDYWEYGISEDTLNHYTWTGYRTLPYSQKPGPYVVKGGHLGDELEYSLAIDYDFSGGKKWLSIVVPIAKGGGRDLSEIRDIFISAKGEDGKSVYVYFELGQLNEDSDGDGVLDKETTTVQNGYPFNNYADKQIVDTYVGGGRQGNGNKIINSEDLNSDGSFDTNESSVLFPNPSITAKSNLIIDSGEWQQKYIKIKTLGTNEVNILKHVSALRITIVKADGSSDTGRILIDKLQFRSSRWEKLTVDGYEANSFANFKVSTISVKNDVAEYMPNRFYKSYPDTFEELHGELTESEEENLDETALRITYNLGTQPYNPSTDTGGQVGSTTKEFVYEQDYSIYQILRFYFYIKEKSDEGREILFFRVMNATNKYYEWNIPLTNLSTGRWHAAEIRLLEDKMPIYIDGSYLTNVVKTQITPNLKTIKMLMLGVNASNCSGVENSGEIWVNEIFLDRDNALKGRAGNIVFSLQYNDKILSWGKFPIISDLVFNASLENMDYDFMTLGQTTYGNKRIIYNLNGRLKLLKYLSLNGSYHTEISETPKDENMLAKEMQSFTTNTSWQFGITISPEKQYIPRIVHTFNYSENANRSYSLPQSASTQSNYNINELLALVENDNLSQGLVLQESAVFFRKLRQSIRFSDNYYISDLSYLSNINMTRFTNENTKGIITYRKSENYNISFASKDLSVSAALTRSSDSYNEQVYRILNGGGIYGYRDMVEEYRQSSLAKIYSKRIDNLFKTIDNIEGENITKISKVLTFSLSVYPARWITPNITLNAGHDEGNYSTITNIYTNIEYIWDTTSYLEEKLSLTFNLGSFVVNSIRPSIGRKIAFRENRGNYKSKWNELLDRFSPYMLKPPMYYIGIWSIYGSRHNAVECVSNYSETTFENGVGMTNNFNLNIGFRTYKSLWLFWTPRRITYNTTLNTSRNRSSYSQSKNWRLVSSHQIPVRKFLRLLGARVNISDIGFDYNMQRIYDYTSKQVQKRWGISSRFNIWFGSKSSISLGYSMVNNKTFISTDTNYHDYIYMGIGYDNNGLNDNDSFGDIEEDSNGDHASISYFSPKTEITHNINMDIRFPFDMKINWKILGLKIKVDANLNYTGRLTGSFKSINYEGTNFNYTEERTIHLVLNNTLKYEFSKNWIGRFFVILAMERYRDIYPNETVDYDIMWGFQIGLSTKIYF